MLPDRCAVPVRRAVELSRSAAVLARCHALLRVRALHSSPRSPREQAPRIPSLVAFTLRCRARRVVKNVLALLVVLEVTEVLWSSHQSCQRQTIGARHLQPFPSLNKTQRSTSIITHMVGSAPAEALRCVPDALRCRGTHDPGPGLQIARIRARRHVCHTSVGTPGTRHLTPRAVRECTDCAVADRLCRECPGPVHLHSTEVLRRGHKTDVNGRRIPR